MFGFDGGTSGFSEIVFKISANDGNLTHKQVRAYARILLHMMPNFGFRIHVEEQIKLLLAAISSPGLPHYDRSFATSTPLSIS